MKERPILFSGPMVRAILDGHKTQTRRVVKFKCFPNHDCLASPKWSSQGESVWVDMANPIGPACVRACPYGVPGDRLWVRETWAEGGRSMQLPCGEFVWSSHRKARYAATDDSIRDGDPSCSWRMRPSIHMPRWASRLTLEVVSVRVERLNEISDMDAIAEGCSESRDRVGNGVYWSSPRGEFVALWDSINAKKHPWSSNPWVWVVEFKRIDAAGGAA